MRILLSISLLIIVYLSGCHSKAKQSDARPNIVFLLADDQRYSTIHAFGNPEITTPTLDRLSGQSMVFNNAYIMGAMSAAVCAPSRAMLMTGRGVFQIPPRGLYIDTAHTTLPETLRENGYVTFGTGKWHNGKASFARSFSSGAKILFGGMTGSQYKLPLYEFDSTGQYPARHRFTLKGEHSSEVYADAAIEFLQTYQKDQPFFMYVSFQAPHDPRQMPEEYREMYDTAAISLPPNFLLKHPFDNGELDVRDELLAKIPRNPAEIKQHIRDYYAMITHLDAQINRILDALKKTGQAENTIIVFTADSGLAVGQHGLMGKQNLYEHTIKVPLLISGPGIPGGEKTDGYVLLNDLFPTLAALADVDIPASVTGYNLKELLDGQAGSKRNSMCYAYKNFQRAYRKGDWKLITYNVKGAYHDQLFNLADDPWEMHNLYAEKDSIARAMKSGLQEALTAAGDSVILSQPGWGVTEIPSWAKMVKQNRGKKH